MISKMVFEPKFKKICFLLSIIMIITASIFLVFQYENLNNIHREKIRTYERLIGTLVKQHPEDEIYIIESFFNESKEDSTYGAKILKKYGYSLENDIERQSSFRKIRRSYLRNNFIAIGSFLIIIFLVITYILLYLLKYLEKISSVLDDFIKGEFNYEDNLADEGIVNVIESQLNQLGRSVSFNYNKLESEKESSKSLVTDISHQLKTPLASLSMCNSILEEDELTKEEKKEFLDMSNKNISKLNALIDSLVNISRLEVAMIKLNPQKNNLRDTILKAYNSAYIKAKHKNIDIVLGDIEEYTITKHDKKWTEEAIFNVLENAIKYSNKSEKIYLDVEDSLNYIKINIKDNGIGISKNEFNNIFKRFYRGKEVEKLEIEGSGVGLYLTRKILEDQSGSIMVKSEKGKGSTFSLFLPKI
ncbi:Signal transduction histidine kinase [Clostridium collagenovorans DSM 3089]|uniref:histidine kinase n=1 Tax=Clostridium collagenovorans DSM 3089 TaxID=1121306 RepID=A0A1M5VD58_9CLOT|nr:HAMP domain-containing sensor histidine kinase [Clostridium collagenovorans]SHH73121.1 Signal transduction histidine kinase [Clostridium collagenovorans DSM 3089]